MSHLLKMCFPFLHPFLLMSPHHPHHHLKIYFFSSPTSHDLYFLVPFSILPPLSSPLESLSHSSHSHLLLHLHNLVFPPQPLLHFLHLHHMLGHLTLCLHGHIWVFPNPVFLSLFILQPLQILKLIIFPKLQRILFESRP